MGAGYMHSISVLFFRSPVFSELQGPIQDRYGIYQGWIQHLRVCILQALCSCEFFAKADRCLHPRGIMPRGWAHVRSRAPFHRFFTGEGACAPTSIQLSKNEVQAVYPWGLGWSRCARVKSRVAPSLIPESHQDEWESMSCCRVDVGSTAKRQHFDSKVLSL